MYGKIKQPGVAAQPTNMSVGYPFDEALRWLKYGRKLTRRGWNGKGMFIYLVRERTMRIAETDETEPLVGVMAEGAEIDYAVRVDMRYSDGRLGVWTPTFDDIFATDWNILT